MTSRNRYPPARVNAITAARPRAKEYTLWDGTLAHFGVRVHPSGIKSFIVQTRVQGRMRKLTLGRFPEMGIEKPPREAATVLARLWGGEAVEPARTKRAPLFRDFADRYRERRMNRWKPSSLETFDIYLKNRLMPHFGRMRLDTIDHVRVSAWFDAASIDRPGAANRAFEILRAMLAAARQWGELGEHVPDACANIAKNRRKPVARFLNREELERFGAVLDRHRGERPWPVVAIRLLTLTGARLSEVLNLRWDEIGELSEDGAGARLEDSKTGPRTVWLGPEAMRLLAALPCREEGGRVFPDDLTSHRLYTFWSGIREEAGLSGLRIHDARHTWASQSVMNGVGLTTVGRLLGHRKRRTTAIYAHFDDAALAGCRRAGGGRHCQGDGIQSRAAANARRCRQRRWPKRAGVVRRRRSTGRAARPAKAALAEGWARTARRRTTGSRSRRSRPAPGIAVVGRRPRCGAH